MNRRGLALLAVLWLLVALMGVAGVTLAALRSGERASLNRLALTRGRWAAESCLAILRARYAAPGAAPRPLEQLAIDSVDLGAPIWCRLTLEAPDTRVNLNRAAPAMLVTVLAGVWAGGPTGRQADGTAGRGVDGTRDSVLIDRILAGRPWPAVAALGHLPGCDSACVRTLEARLTTRGTGQIDPNRASLQVLSALPGMDRSGAIAILGARQGGRLFLDAEQLLGILPPATRQAVMGVYPEFLAATEWSPSELVLHLEGHAGIDTPVAGLTVTAIPLNDRLAIVRREAR